MSDQECSDILLSSRGLVTHISDQISEKESDITLTADQVGDEKDRVSTDLAMGWK